MQKRPQPFTSFPSAAPLAATKDALTQNALDTGQMEHCAREWLYDCEYRQHSKNTITSRRLYLDKLLWFLKTHGHESCGVPELRRFFAYLSTAHEGDSGRWNGTQKRDTSHRALRPSSIATYHRNLGAFFNWCIGEGFIEASPMQRIAAPLMRSDQIQPFTLEQARALIHAARRTRNPERDEVVVRMLLDTGMRASELCTLRMEQLDLFGQRATILGKGNKHRSVHFGSKAARALRNYLRFEPRIPEETVFQAAKNQYAGNQLTPNGLRQIIEHLGELAGLQAVRCSPHTLRHTFAVEFLRNGGNVFSLKEILGHTSLHMTNRYVALAQADIEQQQRQFAPGDRLGV
jgi:site-specific recombinase XerD